MHLAVPEQQIHTKLVFLSVSPDVVHYLLVQCQGLSKWRTGLLVNTAKQLVADVIDNLPILVVVSTEVTITTKYIK